MTRVLPQPPSARDAKQVHATLAPKGDSLYPPHRQGGGSVPPCHSVLPSIGPDPDLCKHKPPLPLQNSIQNIKILPKASSLFYGLTWT